jgi:hypothetical protein
MLSGLPSIADKNFVIGFFLPVIIVLFVTAWVFPDIGVLAPLRTATDKTLGDLAWQVLAVWTLSIGLFTTNHLQYRLLEGYCPPVSWFGWLRAWHRWRFGRIAGRRQEIRDRWAQALQDKREFPADQQDESARLQQRLVTEFPTYRDETRPGVVLPGAIMPTRFGNVIAAFEVYSRQIYNADSIPVWLRLASVVPKDFASEIEDARAPVNCFVNICYLALVVCGFALGRIVAGIDQSHILVEATGMPTHATIQASLPAAACYDAEVALAALVVAWIAYRWATHLAIAWGELVKSAFDCYLPALVRQLGYATPPDAALRQKFWDEFSNLAIYRVRMPTAWAIDPTPAPKQPGGGDADGAAPR